MLSIDNRIFDDYPGFIMGVLVARGVVNSDNNAEIENLLKRASNQVIQDFAGQDVKEHPFIVPWRNAYRTFGAKPKKHLSSIENLIRRVVKSNSVPTINNLVDLYNAVSLKYLIPIGGEDLDTISGGIELTIADDNEKKIILLGESDPKSPKEGEVIYRDDKGAFCRRWNWKEADRTKLTHQTHNAVLVLEALPPITREQLTQATEQLANLIEKYCGGKTRLAILDKDSNQLSLED